MSDSIKTCECGRQFTDAQSSGKWCFRCKLDGLQFNFVGGGSYGREAFHSKTTREVQEETVRRATALGYKPVKRSTRAELV
jgi:hypothetical protein